MAIGRTFPESLQKALRSLETGRGGLNCDPTEAELDDLSLDDLVQGAAVATPDRVFLVEAALRRGASAKLEPGDTFEVEVGSCRCKVLPRSTEIMLYPANAPATGAKK